jgi:hypothetical protein
MITLPVVPDYYTTPRLEYAIAQELQIAFQTKLIWLDRAYHIAKVGIDSEKKIGYPQIHANNGTKEHYDIRADESIPSYSFFEIENPAKIDHKEDQITYNLSAIFWCNLDLIDTSLNYDFTSELIKDVTDLLSFYEADNLTIETRPERIFDKYSGVKQELKQFLMRRFSAFKITFTISTGYTDNCNPLEIDVVALNVNRINNLPEVIREAVISQLVFIS